MYVDQELGLNYVGNIKKIYQKLCISFLEKYANFIDELNNTEDKFTLIHNLKAISLNLGAVKLYEIIKNNEIKDYEEFIEVFNGTYNEIKQL